MLSVRSANLFIILLSSAFISIFSSSVEAQELIPLRLYWNYDRQDNFVTSTAEGEGSAIKAGYNYVRNEACIFSAQEPGTVPLNLYWNSQRGDNFTTATILGSQSAREAGYSFVRVEGYVLPAQEPGTVPLNLYWNSQRGDNFTTATILGSQSAREAGYSFARVEGYAFPANQCNQVSTIIGEEYFPGNSELRKYIVFDLSPETILASSLKSNFRLDTEWLNSPLVRIRSFANPTLSSIWAVGRNSISKPIVTNDNSFVGAISLMSDGSILQIYDLNGDRSVDVVRQTSLSADRIIIAVDLDQDQFRDILAGQELCFSGTGTPINGLSGKPNSSILMPSCQSTETTEPSDINSNNRGIALGNFDVALNEAYCNVNKATAYTPPPPSPPSPREDYYAERRDFHRRLAELHDRDPRPVGGEAAEAQRRAMRAARRVLDALRRDDKEEFEEASREYERLADEARQRSKDARGNYEDEQGGDSNATLPLEDIPGPIDGENAEPPAICISYLKILQNELFNARTQDEYEAVLSQNLVTTDCLDPVINSTVSSSVFGTVRIQCNDNQIVVLTPDDAILKLLEEARECNQKRPGEVNICDGNGFWSGTVGGGRLSVTILEFLGLNDDIQACDPTLCTPNNGLLRSLQLDHLRREIERVPEINQTR